MASPTLLRLPARRQQNTAVMRWIVGVPGPWQLHKSQWAKKERDDPQLGGAGELVAEKYKLNSFN